MKLNLHWKQMPCIAYSQRKELPASPGIYFVGNLDGPVMYIGLSRNLKARHINHHRKNQFESIKNVEIRFRTLPTELSDNIQDIGQSLIRLERQAIFFYNPPINSTAVPSESAFPTSHGPVYVQTHNVKQEGYCAHFDATDDAEIGVNTRKLSMISRAINDSRPIFLIASGTLNDYASANYHNLSELDQFRDERIYVLISKFIPYGYEKNSYEYSDFIVYGGNSRIFRDSYVILNSEPGFLEFKKSYLSLGFTNCERSSFAKILLQNR